MDGQGFAVDRETDDDIFDCCSAGLHYSVDKKLAELEHCNFFSLDSCCKLSGYCKVDKVAGN